MRDPVCNGIVRGVFGHWFNQFLMLVLFLYVLSEFVSAKVSEHTMQYHGWFSPKTLLTFARETHRISSIRTTYLFSSEGKLLRLIVHCLPFFGPSPAPRRTSQIFAAIFEIRPPFPAHASYTSSLSARSRILRMVLGSSRPDGPSLSTAAKTYLPVGDSTP